MGKKSDISVFPDIVETYDQTNDPRQIAQQKKGMKIHDWFSVFCIIDIVPLLYRN